MSNRNGFFNVTSLTNDEIRGNFLGLVVLMHTTYGEALLRPCFEKNGINYEDMLETCCLVLSWERFHLDPQKRVDLEYSSADINNICVFQDPQLVCPLCFNHRKDQTHFRNRMSIAVEIPGT